MAIDFNAYLGQLQSAEADANSLRREEVEDHYRQWSTLIQGVKSQFDIVDAIFSQVFELGTWARHPSPDYFAKGKSQPFSPGSNGYSFASTVGFVGEGIPIRQRCVDPIRFGRKGISLRYAHCNDQKFTLDNHPHGLWDESRFNLPLGYAFVSTEIDSDLLVQTEVAGIEARISHLRTLHTDNKYSIGKLEDKKLQVQKHGYPLEKLYRSSDGILTTPLEVAHAHPVILEVRGPDFDTVLEGIEVETFVDYDISELMQWLFVAINSDRVDPKSFLQERLPRVGTRLLEERYRT